MACPGQGSQKPGMGVSLFGVPEVQAALECASDVFDRDIAALINSEGDEAQAQLNETRNAQVAIAALSIGIGRALMARGIVPDALLGFSLRQVSARMALADMLTDEGGLSRSSTCAHASWTRRHARIRAR